MPPGSFQTTDLCLQVAIEAEYQGQLRVVSGDLAAANAETEGKQRLLSRLVDELAVATTKTSTAAGGSTLLPLIASNYSPCKHQCQPRLVCDGRARAQASLLATAGAPLVQVGGDVVWRIVWVLFLC